MTRISEKALSFLFRADFETSCYSCLSTLKSQEFVKGKRNVRGGEDSRFLEAHFPSAK